MDKKTKSQQAYSGYIQSILIKRAEVNTGHYSYSGSTAMPIEQSPFI